MRTTEIQTFRIILLFILANFLLINDTTAALEVTRVGLDKKSFNPSKAQSVKIGFELTEPANVKVSIYDVLGQEIRIFRMHGLVTGRNSVTWDGFTNNGKLAAGNIFLYSIEAETNDGKKYVYNRAKETGGISVGTLEYTFDKDAGNIEYVLPKTCMVRLRAGLKEGMLARTIFDWTPKIAGRHSLIWDGYDKAQLFNLRKHPDLQLMLNCYTLPANTIIVTGNTTLFDEAVSAPYDKNKRNLIWDTTDKCRHYRHNPLICHEPKFDIIFPGAKIQPEKDIPVLSGSAEIRIEIDKYDAKHLMNSRFEVMIYIDGIFIFEAEEGVSPFSFHLDTKGLKKGPNIITVNVMSYDDHIGVVSKKIIVGD